jgi:hypothetical protein
MVSLRNICINTVHKGDSDDDHNVDGGGDDDDDDDNNNNTKIKGVGGGQTSVVSMVPTLQTGQSGVRNLAGVRVFSLLRNFP